MRMEPSGTGLVITDLRELPYSFLQKNSILFTSYQICWCIYLDSSTPRDVRNKCMWLTQVTQPMTFLLYQSMGINEEFEKEMKWLDLCVWKILWFLRQTNQMQGEHSRDYYYNDMEQKYWELSRSKGQISNILRQFLNEYKTKSGEKWKIKFGTKIFQFSFFINMWNWKHKVKQIYWE